MKRALFFLFVAASLGLSHAAPDSAPVPSAPPAEDDAQAATRSAALALAGAFSNDGYKIRDGFYFGELAPGKSVVLEVNLFAGNEYWFCAASVAPALKIAVKVYDEKGQPVEQQAYADGATGAAGVVAAESGKYLVKISLAEGEKAPFCFLYCYK